MRLSKKARIYDLLESLQELSGVPSRRLVLCEVHGGRVATKFDPRRPVADVGPSDLLVAYEYADTVAVPAPRLRPVRFMHRTVEREASERSFWELSRGPVFKLMGLPVYQFAELTARQAYALIKDIAARCINTGDAAPKVETPLSGSSYPFTLHAVNSAGTACANCSFLSSCSGCLIECDDRVLTADAVAVEWPRGAFNEDEANMILLDDSVALNAERALHPQLVTLEDCLALFTIREKLGEQDTWHCPVCKKHQQAFKKFDLWQLPEILVVHLKRFSYTRWFNNKLCTDVDFPLEGLDLSSFVAKGAPARPPPLYDLYAVSNHHGSLGSGHYTAFARNCHDNRWYNFNDSSCHRVSASEVRGPSSYVLFYRRRAAGSQTSAPR